MTMHRPSEEVEWPAGYATYDPTRFQCEAHWRSERSSIARQLGYPVLPEIQALIALSTGKAGTLGCPPEGCSYCKRGEK
jgi:hypothetical protein